MEERSLRQIEDDTIITTKKEIDNDVSRVGCIAFFFGILAGFALGLLFDALVFPSVLVWEKKKEIIKYEGRLYRLIEVEKVYPEKKGE